MRGCEGVQRSIVTDGTTSQKATSHSCTWTWGCTCIARTPRLRSHTPPLPNTPPTPHPLCTCIGLTRSTSRSSATTSSCWAFRYSSAMPRSSRSCARPSARSSPNSAPTLINPPCAPSVLPLRPLLRPADVPLHPPLISALRCAPPLRPSAAPLRCAPPLRPSAAPLCCAPLLCPSAAPLCCTLTLPPKVRRRRALRHHQAHRLALLWHRAAPPESRPPARLPTDCLRAAQFNPQGRLKPLPGHCL